MGHVPAARPSIFQPVLEATSQRVHVGARVPDPLARSFALAARADGRSLSDALREAMRTYVAAIDESRSTREDSR